MRDGAHLRPARSGSRDWTSWRDDEKAAGAFNERIARIGAHVPAAEHFRVELRRGDVISHTDGKMQNSSSPDRVGGRRLRRRQCGFHRRSLLDLHPAADLRAGELRKRGVKLKLVGQPFEVLARLLERPGELVTREELRTKLWPTDTFGDFDHGLNAAVNKLRDALSDSTEKPRYVETLPRRGYRFIGVVDLPDSQGLLGKPSSPKILSIAVLPLENLSNDPEQEYFADGMTDQLITNLPRSAH